MAQIDKPNLHFNTFIYTGNGTSPRTISGVGFQPDLVFGARRDDAAGKNLYDAVRGAGSTKNLQSNGNGAEGSGSPGTYGYLNAFASDGFTVTAGSSDNAYWNNNTATYVTWNWKANGSGSSNTTGSINSTVSVNTTSNFSIVKYTGNGTSGATVGHGLGAVPKMIIVKQFSSNGGSENWGVYHVGMGNTKYIFLNSNAVAGTNSGYWNDTTPSSTVFTLGNNDVVNNNTVEYIAYCFAEKKGFSSFGKYTGNGNSDGPFVYTGFKPAYIVIKSSTYAGNWLCLDNKREIQNIGSGTPININESNGEDTNTAYAIDFLSNGFKLKNSNGNIQNNNESMFYWAFAENPIVGSNNIAATAQ